jgi:hypothetical protein
VQIYSHRDAYCESRHAPIFRITHNCESRRRIIYFLTLRSNYEYGTSNMSWVRFVFLTVAHCALSKASNLVGLIVPIHEPKFVHVKPLVDSFYRFRIDRTCRLHYVVSSVADLEILKKVVTVSDTVLINLFSGDPSFLTTFPVFYKKWWAVNELIDKYSYFMLLDAEVRFEKEADVYAAARYIMNLKLLFASASRVQWISDVVIQNDMKRFTDVEAAELKSRTSGGLLYLWFNEIPTVENRTAAAFLRELCILTTPVLTNFDILSYYYWLLLRENWNLVDLTPLTGPLELSLGEEGWANNSDAVSRAKPHWVSRRAFDHSASLFPDAFLTFHLDR